MGKKGIIMDREAPASSGGIVKVVSRVSTASPRIDVPIEKAVVAPIALVDLRCQR